MPLSAAEGGLSALTHEWLSCVTWCVGASDGETRHEQANEGRAVPLFLVGGYDATLGLAETGVDGRGSEAGLRSQY